METEKACALCNGPCTEDDYCFGCEHYICSDCDTNENRGIGSHDPEDHDGGE